MEKSNKEGYTLGLLILIVSLFFNFLSFPTVNAAEVNDSTDSEVVTDIDGDSVIVPYDRGSCEELVRAGLLSPRNCGYTQGKPKGGQIWLTPAQADCVFKFYEGAFTNIISIPAGLGGGIVVGYTVWSTLSACKGL